jgi:putative hydrolase of the HAD superfamily
VLKAVTFDLWGTLIRDTREGWRGVRTERIRGIQKALRDLQVISEETIDRAYDLVGERLEALWTTHQDVGIATHIEWLLDVLQAGLRARVSEPQMDQLVEAYTLPILSTLPIPMDGAPEVLASLASRGLRLAVICNTGRTPGKILRIILERLGLAKYLSIQTFSDELCLRKPHPEIFARTLAALGAEPSESLHVGDTLATDFAGARAIGMRAIHFCHSLGADPYPREKETIFSLPDLLRITNSK